MAENLHGHDVSPLLENPHRVPVNALRDGALYCYGMWCYMDAEWLGKILKATANQTLTKENRPKPDATKRGNIRTIFDGRYKYSRYFSPLDHNRPTTIEQIFEVNDVELFDLEKDPYEMSNLANDKTKQYYPSELHIYNIGNSNRAGSWRYKTMCSRQPCQQRDSVV